MTSEDIAHEHIPPSQRSRMNWLREIAYQLAVLNEKQRDSVTEALSRNLNHELAEKARLRGELNEAEQRITLLEKLNRAQPGKGDADREPGKYRIGDQVLVPPSRRHGTCATFRGPITGIAHPVQVSEIRGEFRVRYDDHLSLWLWSSEIEPVTSTDPPSPETALSNSGTTQPSGGPTPKNISEPSTASSPKPKEEGV